MMDELPDWVGQRALSAPDTPAIAWGGAELTYAELDSHVYAVARRLMAYGAGPGKRVALLAHNSLEFALAVHAVPRTGATLVPLNARLSPPEVAWLVGHSGAILVLSHGPTSPLTETVTQMCPDVRHLSLEGLAAASDGPAGLLVEAHAPGETLAIMYTSGTTGRPRGAMLTFGNFWASAAGSAYNMGMLPGDRWLACLPLFHVGGLSILVRSAIYGTTAVIHQRFDAGAVNRSLREEGVTLLSVVPTMLQRMLDADSLPYPPSVRAVLVGGGPVTPHLLERALGRGLPVLQTYGLTESTSQVSTLAPADALRHIGSAGKPLVTTRLRVDAPPGEPGEILVAGPTITAGYLDDPEATARAMRDGWFHTGDVGRLDEDGFLYVLDRRDDLIISGGENVYPAEVEGVLLQHPAVVGTAVVGIPDAHWGQTVAAAVVLREALSPEDLAAWLRARVAGFKVPRQFRVVDELPATASGKVQRHRVRAWFEAGGPPR